MALAEVIARYVAILERAASETHRAEDRPLFQELLADSAGLLSAALIDIDPSRVRERVSKHERLWGHLWIQGDCYRETRAAWQEVVDAR